MPKLPTRRSLLKALGASAALLPFLPATEAEAETLPRRIVFFFTPDGTLSEKWQPSGTVDDVALEGILAPLAKHQADLVLLDGIDMVSAAHGPGNAHAKGMGHALTASELIEFGDGEASVVSGGGVSVDQLIAGAIGVHTPFPSLELAVRNVGGEANDVLSHLSYRAAGQPVVSDRDPLAAFERLFGTSLAPAELARRRSERQSVIDFVRGDLVRLESKLSGNDLMRIEAHLAALRGVETRLQAAGPTSCVAPPAGDTIAAEAMANYPVVGARHMDIIAAAFACDLTRVATLQWSHGAPSVEYSGWLGTEPTSHHEMSHAAQDAPLSAIYGWYAQQFAELIDRLKAIPEGDGTVFDNTTLVWLSDLADGRTHSHENLSYVIAGGGWHFGAGNRYLRYNGHPHGNLLVSLCHAMGLHDVHRFGDPEFCTGPLVGLESSS